MTARFVEGLVLPTDFSLARHELAEPLPCVPAYVSQRDAVYSMLDDGARSALRGIGTHRDRRIADAPLRHPLPVSEMAQERGLILPLFPQMTSDELAQVASALQRAVADARRSSSMRA